MTDRRAFLKSLLGLAAGTALPLPLEALAEAVALPGEATKYTLSFFCKGWSTSAAFIDVKIDGVEYQDGWRRAVIPIRADSDDEAMRIAYQQLADSVFAGVTVLTDFPAGPTLEVVSPTPYIPTSQG